MIESIIPLSKDSDVKVGIINEDLRELDIELSSLRIKSAGGIGTSGLIVEHKSTNGEWVTLGGIQSLVLELDVESPFPRVHIEYIIF